MKRSLEIELPDDWTPEQALAACELLHAIITAIWEAHDERLAELCHRQAMLDARRELEDIHDVSLSADDADDIPL